MDTDAIDDRAGPRPAAAPVATPMAVPRAGAAAVATRADGDGPSRCDVARRAEIHHALGEPHRLRIVDALRCSDHTPSELAALTGIASNLVAFHLNVLDDAGLIARTPSEGDARRRYVRLDADLATLLAPRASFTADDVLFVCTHNSARSQLAAALWQRATGRSARSAGHDPAPEVHGLAREVAADRGLDLSVARPRGFADVADREPDLIVSVCDRVREAGWPLTTPALHWSVPDPVGHDRDAFEAAYELLADRVAALAALTRAA
jgi:ArsR family transcriptional regulator, arsenate/arsenite/antimonite-responsive transcriptional repressor / arsenate reductase (thioredoxin)